MRRAPELERGLSTRNRRLKGRRRGRRRRGSVRRSARFFSLTLDWPVCHAKSIGLGSRVYAVTSLLSRDVGGVLMRKTIAAACVTFAFLFLFASSRAEVMINVGAEGGFVKRT